MEAQVFDTHFAQRRSGIARVAQSARRALVLMRPLLYAVGAWLFTHPLAQSSTTWVSAACAVLGGWAGTVLHRARFRGVAMAAASTTCLVVTWALCNLAIRFVPAGVATKLALHESLMFGGITLAVTAGLSFFRHRARWTVVFEVAVVAFACAELLAAHRFGAVTRPFEIADPILTRGGDPMVAFVWAGALTALVLTMLLLRERSLWRAMTQLALTALLLWLVGTRVRMPTAPLSDDALGLRARGKQAQGRDSAKDDSRQRADQQTSGSNNDMDFQGPDSPPSSRRSPVAVVVLDDDYSPPSGTYYFRQGALSQFNGRRLVASNEPGVDDDVRSEFSTDTTVAPARPRSAGASAFRRELKTRVALIADHPRPFGLEAPMEFRAVGNPNPARFVRVYEVKSAVLETDFKSLLQLPAGSPSWTERTRDAYLQLPSDERYKALSDEILSHVSPEFRQSPMVRAFAISDWLGKQGVYSLKSKHADAEDPTADFLFGDKTGYCVHFAHAAVYLMRAAGLPARVATGYAVPEDARQGGASLLLADQDGHAWPEVYLDQVGWVVVDVHPKQYLDPPPEPPDPELQRLLGELAQGQAPWKADDVTSVDEWRTRLARLGMWARNAGLGVLFMSIVLLYVTKWGRRIAPHVSSPQRVGRAAYRGAADRLADLGVVRRHGETQSEFATRVGAMSPAFATLTDMRVAEVFGARTHSHASWRAVYNAMGHDLRRSTPRPTRLRGLLHPAAWLRVR
jgi:transglutaminase-like putative cysteine protease/uncharacterized membrane protein (UPF0136 family)